MSAFFIFLFSLASAIAQQYSITGDQDVCPADLQTYVVTGSPSPVTYTWQVTAANGSIINYVTSGCEVLWNLAGAAIVDVLLFDASGTQLGSASLNVTVHPSPVPVLTTSFNSECVIIDEHNPIIDPSDCWNVCENSGVNYYVDPYDPGSQYTWSVAGGVMQNISGNTMSASWGAAGNGLVMISQTNQFGCAAIDSHCVNIHESPTAILLADVQNADCRNISQITVCVNQIVNFSGDAELGSSNSPIIAWSWDFGDGSYSSLQNPTHFWSLAGSYMVTLTVTNACNCTGTCTILVMVDPLTGVNIECVGPVCPNTIQEYYTDAINCSQYAWSVTGGTIQNSPFNTSSDVTILWGNGSNGPGMLCLSNSPVPYCSDYCPSTTCVEVPIVSATSTISGPALACVGEQYTYSVPIMTGSIYTWTVTGGTIDMGLYTHEIVVTWNTAGPGAVEVTYNNAFLDCGGSGLLNVDVKTPFTISGPTEACPGDQLTFDALNPSGNMLDWTATDGNGTVNYLGSTSGQLTVNWTLGHGEFVIMATPAGAINYCNANATLTLVVHEPPTPPQSISGEDLVCPGSAQTYTAPGAPSSIVYNWTITGGYPAQATGSQVSVMWGANGPYILSLTQTNTVTGCVADPYQQPINRKSYSQPTFDQAGNACINKLETYNINNGYQSGGAYYYDDITWMISPTDAGSVTQGQGTTSATIQWNNTPLTGVTIWVSTRLCGADIPSGTFIQLDLVGSSSVTITPSGAQICEGVAQSFNHNGNGTAYWDFGLGQTSSNSNVWNLNGQTGGPFTFPVTVEVTDAAGCKALGNTFVDVLPSPVIGVAKSPNCYDGATPVTLTAITPGSGNYNYIWSTGQTSASISLNQTGSYTVTVTGQGPAPNICQSQITEVVNNCNVVPPCIAYPGAQPPLLTSSIMPPGCGDYEFTGSFSLPAGCTMQSWSYSFGDNSSVNGTGALTTNVTHHYQVAASYLASLNVEFICGGQTYCASAQIQVEVEAVGVFSTLLACPSGSSPDQYQVTFNDQSTYLNSINNYNWQWSFGFPLPGSNSQSPTISMPSQTYQVSLIISNSTANFSCEVIETVVIPDVPDPDFLVVDPNQPLPAGPFCATQTLTEFKADNTNVHHALWNFGDGTSYVPVNPINSIDAYKVYDGTFPNPTVSLTVYDSYGCAFESDTTFNVELLNLNGNIQPVSGVSFCPGAAGVLYYNSNVSTWPTNYLWSNGATTNSISVNTTGSYSLTVYNSNTGCAFPVPAFGNAFAYNVPTPSIVGDLTLCEGETMALDGQSGITGSGYTYNWTVTDPQGTVYNTTGPQFSLSQVIAGTYQSVLTISSSSPACQTTATATIEVYPAPATPVITVTPLPACEDQAVLLSVNPLGNAVNWSTGQSNATIQVVSSGIYQVTLTNTAGCTASNNTQVYDNPYTGWFTTGCFEFCDTADVVIPGSGLIEYDKWTWFIDHVPVPGMTGSSSSVPNLIIPAQTPPGVYLISLELEVHYPGQPLQVCAVHTLELEITIKQCPCHVNPEVKLYCASPQVNDAVGPHVYHFVLTPGVQLPCTGTSQVEVTSPDGGITLMPGTVQPNIITGLIQTNLNTPSPVCFELDITDPNEPLCNCLYTLCHRLPECVYPEACSEAVTISNVVCVGINQGNPVYTFDYTITFTGTSFPRYVQFYSASQGVLSGLTAVIINAPGTYTYSGIFEDHDINDGFCIEFSVYDFQTHTMCTQRACENNPPTNCRIGQYRTSQLVNNLPVTETKLDVVPNPSSGDTYFDFSVSTARAQLCVRDMQGILIRQWPISSYNGRIEMNAMDIQPGIYLVQIIDSNGISVIRKWIVL